MVTEAGAAAINTGVNAGVGVLNTAAQLYTNKKNREFEEEQSRIQREWNEKMYNEQNAWNYDMWLKQNEYNTPAAQVQRLRDAGLNPMFYGLDGTGNAGELTAAQPLGYDRAQVNQLNPISAGIDASLKVAQISNIQANTAKQNNENQTETARREKLLADIETTRQQLENLKSQKNLTDAEVRQIDKALEWTDRMNTAILAEKESAAALNNAQKQRIEELLEGEKLLQSKTLEDFDKKWAKIDAEIKKMAKETGLLALDIENYALNHASNGFLGSGLSFQNFIRAIAEGKKTSKGKSKREPDAGFVPTDYGIETNTD